MSRPYFSSILPNIGAQFMGLPGMLTGGQSWFVDPYYGLDGNSGKRPDRPFKTLQQALDSATADQNDIVYLLSRSNTGTYTTDYQTAMLDWDKDGVHLIGVNNGSFIGQRSRIAWKSTATAAATELFRVSADNCLISGIEVFQGLASGTSMLGGMNVTGTRNHFHNCQISGMGHADNVIAGAYSLALTGAAENFFERCYIGLDTIPRATDTTSELRVLSAATRNMFLDCTFVSQIGHATYSPYVYFYGADAVDRWIHFKRCSFINFATNYAFTQAVAFLHSATPTKGVTWVDNCSAMATNWSAAGVKTYISNPAINTAYTGGTGYAS